MRQAKIYASLTFRINIVITQLNVLGKEYKKYEYYIELEIISLEHFVFLRKF